VDDLAGGSWPRAAAPSAKAVAIIRPGKYSGANKVAARNWHLFMGGFQAKLDIESSKDDVKQPWRPGLLQTSGSNTQKKAKKEA
jgi:hypothetical protein